MCKQKQCNGGRIGAPQIRMGWCGGNEKSPSCVLSLLNRPLMDVAIILIFLLYFNIVLLNYDFFIYNLFSKLFMLRLHYLFI